MYTLVNGGSVVHTKGERKKLRTLLVRGGKLLHGAHPEEETHILEIRRLERPDL